MELVLLSEQHLDDLAELIADPDVLVHTRVPEPPPEGFARQWLDRYEARRAAGEAEAFAIVEDGRFAGLALAPEIDHEGRECELGYIVTREARGRGLATEALGALTAWAFEALGMLRAVLIINVGNVPSEKVAERAGYTLEGVMRSIHLKQDRRVDAGLWSRLPSDDAANARSR